MLAETYSIPFANRFSTTDPIVPQGYFRSKLFVSSSTSNPMLAAASPLLSLLERLGISHTLPAIESIRDNIQHELFAFLSQLTALNYAEESTSMANYLLSATIDELLGKNYLRLYGQPIQFQAFTPSRKDELGPEHRFFDLVNYIKQRTNQYLDLIELAYYCLITGFEGKQHLQTNGRQILDNLIEELYQLILQCRVHKPTRLFSEQTISISRSTSFKHLLTGSFITISLLSAVYIGSHMLLNTQAVTLLSDHLGMMNG